MIKMNELIDQPTEELELKLTELRNELFNRRNQKQVTKKDDKPHLLRSLRKTIARILTIINERNAKSQG